MSETAHLDGVDPFEVGRLVTEALQAGAARVELRAAADDDALLAAAMTAGLRREGVLRSARGSDLVLLGRLASDIDPELDALPSIAASMPRSLRAAGWYLSDASDRVLLVDPVYKEGFDIPGGVAEAGESLLQAANRELREELDLTLPPSDLLVLDFSPANERRGDIELAIFDGGRHAADLVRQLSFPDGELTRAVWLHPDDLDGQAPPALVRRLRAIHAGRRTGRLPGPTITLRDGYPEGQDRGQDEAR